jgi:transposase
VKTWIHTPIVDEAAHREEVETICAVYGKAVEMHAAGIHVVSCDEKTGIQALEREITAMQPGRQERQDNSYERHGTQCLMANFEVATGKIVAPTIGDTRTEEDFVRHVQQTVQQDPQAEWVFVVDQLNTHKSAGLVEWVGQSCGIETELGIKGECGILENMQTRKAFLSDPAHRIRFVYTPKHASWLNQVEIWFSILVRRLLKRLSVKSIDELKQKIMAFIGYFNRVMAKPLKWTYKGRPLQA